MLSGLVGVVVFALCIHSLTRSARFDFDESNTLRIAAQTSQDLVQILSLEQNFPPYYLVLHWLRHEVAIKLFHLACWVLTLLVGRRVLAYYAGDGLKRAAAWILFATVPYLCQQAFYVRMYGLTSLILMLQMFLLLRLHFEDRDQPIWLGVLGLMSASIHILGIVPGLGAVGLRHWIRPLSRKALLGLMALPLVGGGFQLLRKADPVLLYRSAGVSYVETLQLGFADRGLGFWLNSVYFLSIEFWGACFFAALLCFTALHLVRAGRYRSPEYAVPLVLGGGLLLLPVLLPHGFSQHHAAFFVAPLALLLIVSTARFVTSEAPEVLLLATGSSMVLAAELWRHPWTHEAVGPGVRAACYFGFAATALGAAILAGTTRGRLLGQRRRRHLAGVVGAGLAVAHFGCFWGYVEHTRGMDARYSRAVASFRAWPEGTDRGMVFTTFTNYNVVRLCFEEGSPIRVVLAQPAGVLDTTPLAPVEVLEEQARRGGQALSGAENLAFLTANAEVARLLARYQPDAAAFFYPSQACDWGLPLNQLDFKGYRFERCEAPGIFYYAATR